MSKPIRIIIVDDHQIVRDGLRFLISDEPNMTIIAEAENGQDLLDKLAIEQPDIVLLDIRMPVLNGIQVTEKIHRLYPDVKIIILSMHDEEEYITKALQAGAQGYLLKKTGKEELLRAIHTVVGGTNYFSNDVSAKMLSRLMNRKSMNKPMDGHKSSSTKEIPLTSREIEIIRLIVQEYTNAEIAERLTISPRTVDTHRRNLLQKTGVKNTAGLVKFAMMNGLLND
ncbi:MAG: response regulator transcription factor [Bacteroidia bacterium]|nr:response regulator transcription factor [Bacteroidia bacterium]